MNSTTKSARPARTAFLALLFASAASSALADAAADVTNVEEVTVTARRREETVQEIPLAVSVIGGKQIDLRLDPARQR